MSKYYVNAPDGKSVSVASPFGIQQFIHGTFMYDDNYARIYPNLFILMPDTQPPAEKPVKEKPKKTEEKVIVEKKVVDKKKTGLPKKIKK